MFQDIIVWEFSYLKILYSYNTNIAIICIIANYIYYKLPNVFYDKYVVQRFKSLNVFNKFVFRICSNTKIN